MHEQQGLKFLAKPKKGKMGGLAIVLGWILLWNVIYQVLHHSWHEMPVVNWAFFISVTIFFMQEELTYKARFWHTLIGGGVGLCLAAGMIFTYSKLAKAGLNATAAILIPLMISIALLIMLNPYLPVFFNNVGFCYFIIALIDSSAAITNLPKYLLSLLLGSLILNLGCSGLLSVYTKSVKKKAAASIKAAPVEA